MKLLILGGTGSTGHHLVQQALEAGHSVAALARDPRKVTEPIEVIEGDATDASTVAGAARGRDAIVSALGSSNSLKGGIMMRAVPVLLAAMQQNGVKRLILQSSFGVAESFDEATAIQKFFFHTLLRSIYADKAKADAMIEASPLEWTIVRPVRLTNGPRTGKYRVSERFDARGPKSVSRADVADFMIRELTEREWIRKIAVIA